MRIAVWRAIAAVLLVGMVASGCSAQRGYGADPFVIAGGGTAGVYYNYGAHLASALADELGIEARVVETHGSVDNLRRVGSGEALIGFAQADAAADAVSGSGSFTEPLPIRAVARVYDEYVHVVVPADSSAHQISDLAGATVSLGAETSGVEVIASRVLDASGISVDEIDNPALGLTASMTALEDGEIDGFFWVGGIPTPSIEVLAERMPIRLLSIDADTVNQVNLSHAGVYRHADYPLGVYGTSGQGVTMTVPNYLVTSENAPEDLIYDVVSNLFASRAEIAQEVPSAEYLDRRQAIFTDPIDLHPGASRYFLEARY